MSVLGFLEPAADSTDVIARSPMERLARSAGAGFESRDGWNVAVSFGDVAVERERIARTVGFVDRCTLTKFELSAPTEQLASLALRPGSAELRDGVWWCPVTPERVLVLAEPGSAAARARAAVDALGGRPVDLSCALSAMSLIGPQCRELLARICAIDVRPAIAPVRAFRPGSVARTPGYVLVEDADRLLIMVGWALGHYLWQVVADAAEHLGGGPVGVDALSAPGGAQPDA